MTSPVRVLLVEDMTEDAECLLDELRKAGLDFVSTRVATPQALERALDAFTPDLVLSDCSVRAFGPPGDLRVLDRVLARLPEVPFILVSNTFGEERASEALRRGATDCVPKNNPGRLAPAIRRALAAARDRQERIAAERARDASEHRFRLFMEHFPGGAFLKDLEGRYTYVNHGVEKALGKPAAELIGKTLGGALPLAGLDEVPSRRSLLRSAGEAERVLLDLQTPDGPKSLLVHRFDIPDGEGKPLLIGGIFIDMTQQLTIERSLALSEERFRSIAEATQEWIWDMDRSGAYTFCSPAAEAITGYSPESLLGRSSIERVYSRAQTGVERELQRAVVEKRGWRGLVLRLQHRDGSTRWVDSNAFPLFDAAGEVIGFRGAARDVTERIVQQQRIARLSRIQAVLSEINSMIIRVSNRTELFRDACRIAGEHGGFMLAWVGLRRGEAHEVQPLAWHGEETGYLAELGRASASGLISKPQVRLALAEKRSVVVNDIQNDPNTVDRDAALERGYRSMVALPLFAEQLPVGVLMLYAAEVGFFTTEELKLLDNLAADISFALDHLAKEERLAYVSHHDLLTGLPNRPLFFERLGQLTQQTTRSEEVPLAVLVIDVDRFGFINDSMGRGAGDALLIEFANRLRGAFSDLATPARISGGRFAMVVDGFKGAALALHVRERILRSLAAPVQLEGVELHVTAKVGIAFYPQDGDDAERLFMNAEAAVQRAKDTAESTVFYAPELNARVAQRLHLESRLRQAIELRQFVLHYQPKVDLQTRRMVGVEALIRWLDPERGLIPPLEFIPLLEETGLIVEVGRWVMMQAVADFEAWRAAGLTPPRVAVNVSQAQLRRKEFVATVLAALPPGRDVGLDLEITESLVMADGDTHIAKLHELRAAGLRVHMDDFGTGYSSLGQIARLPLDTLKIDRAFITGMAEGHDHMAIVSMVIGLAKALKLQVVAEGVESETQAQLLESLGCDQGQGWLFSRPITAQALEQLLRAERATAPAVAEPSSASLPA